MGRGVVWVGALPWGMNMCRLDRQEQSCRQEGQQQKSGVVKVAMYHHAANYSPL